MIVDDRTADLDLPLPSQENELDDDIIRLRDAFALLDALHTFAALKEKPTTVSGFGITDAYTKAVVDGKLSDLVAGAPSELNTLNKLAVQLLSDENAKNALTQAFNAHVGSSGNTHGLATSLVAGFMSAADKVKVGAFDGSNYLPKNMLVVNTPPDLGTVTLAVGATDGALAVVDGYGIYQYSSTNTDRADGEFVVAPSSGSGRWTLVAPAWDFVWAYLAPIFYDKNRQILALASSLAAAQSSLNTLANNAPITLQFVYLFGTINSYTQVSHSFSFPGALLTDTVTITKQGTGGGVSDYELAIVNAWVNVVDNVLVTVFNPRAAVLTIGTLGYTISIQHNTG